MPVEINDIIHVLVRITANSLTIRILQDSNCSGRRVSAYISRQCCIGASQSLVVGISDSSREELGDGAVTLDDGLVSSNDVILVIVDIEELLSVAGGS